jgi:hypothetical protein
LRKVYDGTATSLYTIPTGYEAYDISYSNNFIYMLMSNGIFYVVQIYKFVSLTTN